MIRVAINGFGRIGRAFFRLSVDDPGVQVVALNDRVGAQDLAYLLKYDSVHGAFNYDVTAESDQLTVGRTKIKAFSSGKIKSRFWKGMDLDVVVEATGSIRTLPAARKHISAGAKKVLITSIPKEDSAGDIPMFIYGVNEEDYRGERIVSGASCSANCAAPVLKVLNETLKVEYGTLTAVHAYTTAQKLLDSAHSSDPRRGRAAGLNIIPSPSDAARVVAELVPGMKGRLMGSTVRVPVADGSILEIVCKVGREVHVKEIHDIIKSSAHNENKGIIEYSSDPIVSGDIVNNTSSAIYDALSTTILPPSFIKIALWYDHEWGYAARLLDIVKHICSYQGK